MSIDREHKLVGDFEVTGAAINDRKMFEDLLDDSNTGLDVWADSADRSVQRVTPHKRQGYRPCIQIRGTEKRALIDRALAANHHRAKVRARNERVFPAQAPIGVILARSLGLARAGVKIGMINIVYNLRRFVFLEGRCAQSNPRKGEQPRWRLHHSTTAS